jgi:hypothetical protein
MAFSSILVRCLAKAAVKNVANLLTFGVGGDLLIDVWDAWSRSQDKASRKAEIEHLAAASPAEARAAATQAVQQECPALPADQRQQLTEWLTQTPAAIRRSLTRPSDPTGTTLPATLPLSGPEDLVQLLPPTPGEKYRLAAVEAAKSAGAAIADRIDRKTACLNAWKKATERQFPVVQGRSDEKKNKDYQRKGCPKNAFLGLCEGGYVKGIERWDNAEKPNKRYAIDAYQKLANRVTKYHAIKDRDTLVTMLWKAVRPAREGKKPMQHNHQMDVVVALWEAQLLNEPE